MKITNKSKNQGDNTSAIIRSRIIASSDRYWTYRDFDDLPGIAVSKSLSRLGQNGTVIRVRKGVYYRPKETILGKSKPSMTALGALIVGSKAKPTGITAAHILGFTTQNSIKLTYVLPMSNPITNIPGYHFIVRRGNVHSNLTDREAAVLEFIRDRGIYSEIEPEAMVARLISILKEPGLFEKLVEPALQEPPRVRAILGALGEAIGAAHHHVLALRKSINKLSRFNFGALRVIDNARNWQAR